MLRLEARPQPSQFWSYGSPLLALLLHSGDRRGLVPALGKDPVRGLQVFFWEPIKTPYALGELMVKATPLLIIALGLAVCFRSNVWNIGAEGQFVIGALAAGGVALMADKGSSGWIVVPVLLAGVLGGMVWAGITALLRDRFNASEILVSLMLVYVADMVLSYLVYGPWKDPAGYNFPQTKTFEAATRVPRLFEGSRVSIGLLIARSVCCGAVGVPVPHPRRLCPAGRWSGPGGGALCRLFLAQGTCGPRCWSRVVRPVWPVRWRWPGPSASSRPMCRRVMALRPSSWPLSGGCIRWAWFSRRS